LRMRTLPHVMLRWPQLTPPSGDRLAAKRIAIPSGAADPRYGLQTEIVRAAGVIAGTTIDLVGRIGQAALAHVMPPAPPSLSAMGLRSSPK
jgi:hypothetical protein